MTLRVSGRTGGSARGPGGGWRCREMTTGSRVRTRTGSRGGPAPSAPWSAGSCCSRTTEGKFR